MSIGFELTGIKLFGLLVAAFIWAYIIKLYRRNQFKRKELAVWGFVATGLAVGSLFTGLVLYPLKYFTRLSRGLDILIVLSIFALFGIVFQTYVRIQETNRQITDLTRKVAIALEEKKNGKKKQL